MKRYLLPALLCMLFVFQANGIIKGNIIGTNNSLIKGAVCKFYELPDSVVYSETITDAKGRFKLDEPEGDWWVEIDCPGDDTYVLSRALYQECLKKKVRVVFRIGNPVSESLVIESIRSFDMLY